jgi:LuxR family maltose regulon positive regulatory protein
LVETKFFLPRAREGFVARPRLDGVLGWSQRGRLTLVSAPAGFGKTTLLASWLAQGTETRQLAWVALDESDREAERFWTYVLTALDRAAPGTGAAGLSMLATGQPIEVALVAVLNELSVLPEDIDLVLDDYHLAESPAIQPGMTFLLDRLPPQVRLVISTRADPALPLARFRARGELTEIRAADLRFTPDEINTFLVDAAGLDLDPMDVAALGARTEGWIASLQLAAVSLRGRADPAHFITGFTGDDRYVMDYLVEEVLTHEPTEIREFLTATSILSRLTGPLCDAVTGGGRCGQVLESLERRNLFVVALDDQRRWYRYHHLFGDVLRSHLLAEQPDQASELHRRASRWYADAGETEDAVRHALAAGEVASAADLIELAIPELRRLRRESLIRRWVDELPGEVVGNRPVLAAGFIGALMASNDFVGVPPRLQELERLLARPQSELVVVDQAELARLPGAVETWWAGLALVGGDPAAAIAHAERAMGAAVEGDDLITSAAAALAGLASWTTGDIPAAHRDYAVAVYGLARADHIADVLGCSLAVADMELTLGRLRDAERTIEHALALADRHGSRGSGAMRGTADMLVALSRTAWHRNDLASAADLLRRADDLGELAGLPQHPYRWRVAMARLRVAAGDYSNAIELLHEAERVYVGDFSPEVHPIHATRARVLAASGNLAAASAWAREHGVSDNDDLSYLREYEHLTLARVLLAEHSANPSAQNIDRATRLLNRLLAAAEAGSRRGTVLEVQVLRTLALRTAGDADLARDALAHAVDIAEADRWIRYFVDAGPGMADALAELASRIPHSDFLQHLRIVATTGAPQDAGLAVGPSETLGPRTAAHELLDPLSDRELDVLRLLGSDLDGPAIARELVVSMNTVRTHTKHIYTKLAVNNRRAAITKAHQLGILARTARR